MPYESDMDDRFVNPVATASDNLRRDRGVSPRGVSLIEEKMEALGASIDRVDSAILKLCDKIGLVLGPDMEGTKEGSINVKEKDDLVSPMAALLQEKIDWLNRMALTIENHTGRVQL